MKPKPLFSSLDRRKNITLGQLSKLTDIPLTTLRDWVNKGEIPGAFRGSPGKGRKWRFNREALERWWEEMQQSTVG